MVTIIIIIILMLIIFNHRRPTADVLALEARERMKWDDDDSDHHFEELSHAVVDLSMKVHS